jgi:hypothetical protein
MLARGGLAATVVAVVQLAGVVAHAQSDSRKAPVEDSPAAQTGPGAGTAIELQKLHSVLGIEVRTRTEQNVGRIVDLLADRAGQLEAAVVEFGGFLGMGTRKIAIEWPALRLETSGKQIVAILDMPRDQLRAAPEYKVENPVVVRRLVQPIPGPERVPAEETAAPMPSAAPPLPAKEPPKPRRKRHHHHRDRD